MSHSQVDDLINIVLKILLGDTFKVKNHNDINSLWDLAATHLSLMCVFFHEAFFVLI
jgi:hypothetical protein